MINNSTNKEGATRKSDLRDLSEEYQKITDELQEVMSKLLRKLFRRMKLDITRKVNRIMSILDTEI